MTKSNNMSLWMISREYAGIAEAGGVKNVVCSLSEALVKENVDVTLFIPLYGCTMLSSVTGFDIIPKSSVNVSIDGKNYTVSYGVAETKGVKVIFIITSFFTEKMGVYVYTEIEERINPLHKRGSGHIDAQEMEIVFQKAVLEYGIKYKTRPNIIHCHDATTAFIPSIAKNNKHYKKHFKSTKFVVTIHNAGPAYHHEIKPISLAQNLTDIPQNILEKGIVNDAVEPYLLAGFDSELTTVSPWYAEELMNPKNDNTAGLSEAFFENNMEIIGITNGIDFEKYDPTDIKKSLLPYPFNPGEEDLDGKYTARKNFLEYYSQHRPSDGIRTTPGLNRGVEQFGFIEDTNTENFVYFSYHGRIVHQKGLDVLAKAIPIVFAEFPDARFIITGQGAEEIEEEQVLLAEKYLGKFLYLRGYERSLARLCVAVADFIVLPSKFEPCGLEDFIGSIFGTLPIAHATGGLQKIQNNKTGFLYKENTPEELAKTMILYGKKMQTEKKEILTIIKNAFFTVKDFYSWQAVIQNSYNNLYKNLLK